MPEAGPAADLAAGHPCAIGLPWNPGGQWADRGGIQWGQDSRVAVVGPHCTADHQWSGRLSKVRFRAM